MLVEMGSDIYAYAFEYAEFGGLAEGYGKFRSVPEIGAGVKNLNVRNEDGPIKGQYQPRNR